MLISRRHCSSGLCTKRCSSTQLVSPSAALLSQKAPRLRTHSYIGRWCTKSQIRLVHSVGAQRDSAHPHPFSNDVEPFVGALAPMFYEDFEALCARAPRSAPGPDGVPNVCWAFGESAGLRLLYELHQAVIRGDAVPYFFKEVWMAPTPKAPAGMDHPHAVLPAGLRPLTLSSTTQKVLAKVLDAPLGAVARSLVHGALRGFVRGRKMSSNIVGLEASMEELLRDPTSDSDIVLLGIQAAFPGIDWGRLRWVWHRLGIPEWLRRAVFATFKGSAAELLLHGRRVGVHLGIACGITSHCARRMISWRLRSPTTLALQRGSSLLSTPSCALASCSCGGLLGSPSIAARRPSCDGAPLAQRRQLPHTGRPAGCRWHGLGPRQHCAPMGHDHSEALPECVMSEGWRLLGWTGCSRTGCSRRVSFALCASSPIRMEESFGQSRRRWPCSREPRCTAWGRGLPSIFLRSARRGSSGRSRCWRARRKKHSPP